MTYFNTEISNIFTKLELPLSAPPHRRLSLIPTVNRDMADSYEVDTHRIGVKYQLIRDQSSELLISELLNAYRNSKNHARFHAKKYKKAINILLANFHIADTEKKILITPYSQLTKIFAGTGIARDIVQALLEYFAKIGLIDLTIGNRNQFDKVATTCRPTSLLELIFHNYQIRSKLANGDSFIRLRAKKKKGQSKGNEIRIPDSRSKQHKLLNEPVSKYNEFMLDQLITSPEGKYYIPYYERICSHGRLDRGGRWYSRISNLLKADRKAIRINGSINAEPDFTAVHIFIAYWLLEIPYDVNEKPYEIKGYEDYRDLIKVVILALLNGAKSDAKASHITYSAKPSTKEYYQKSLQKTADYKAGKRPKPQPNFKIDKVTGEYKLLNESMMPDSLTNFIKDVPEGTNGSEIIDAILEKHSPLKGLFDEESPEYLDNIGLRLQFIDSEIMALIQTELIKRNIVGLPVHDSVVCPYDRRHEVAEVMGMAYRSFTGGFEIPVEQRKGEE